MTATERAELLRADYRRGRAVVFDSAIEDGAGNLLDLLADALGGAGSGGISDAEAQTRGAYEELGRHVDAWASQAPDVDAGAIPLDPWVARGRQLAGDIAYHAGIDADGSPWAVVRGTVTGTASEAWGLVQRAANPLEWSGGVQLAAGLVAVGVVAYLLAQLATLGKVVRG